LNLFLALLCLGLVENNRSREALDLFQRVLTKRNEHTYGILFKICASIADEHALKYGQTIFKAMPDEYRTNMIILTSYFHMLIRCGDSRSAEELFSERLVRNVISYGSMMKVFNHNGQADKTLKLFDKMNEEQISPNEIIFQLLIDACSQIGDLSLAQRIVSQIPLNSHSLDSGLIDMWVRFFSLRQRSTLDFLHLG
jgi:pentatricopeptide repeat protein